MIEQAKWKLRPKCIPWLTCQSSQCSRMQWSVSRLATVPCFLITGWVILSRTPRGHTVCVWLLENELTGAFSRAWRRLGSKGSKGFLSSCWSRFCVCQIKTTRAFFKPMKCQTVSVLTIWFVRSLHTLDSSTVYLDFWWLVAAPHSVIAPRGDRPAEGKVCLLCEQGPKGW
jgi:hypothetical protein